MLPLPGLSPVGGKTVVAKFDGVLSYLWLRHLLDKLQEMKEDAALDETWKLFYESTKYPNSLGELDCICAN